MRSHPSWVRGLKLILCVNKVSVRLVAPLVGAWIETYNAGADIAQGIKSHPSWVRGLKQNNAKGTEKVQKVAPLVGAWIETHF